MLVCCASSWFLAQEDCAAVQTLNMPLQENPNRRTVSVEMLLAPQGTRTGL